MSIPFAYTTNLAIASFRTHVVTAGVDFLAFPPINIGEIYKKIFDLRKVISQSEILFDLKQLHQLSVGL